MVPNSTGLCDPFAFIVTLTVTIPFGTPVPKAFKMHCTGTSQPWMPKMFQGTLTEIERRFRCWYKKISWVKFLISCKPEVSHTSLVLRTYMNVSNIPEHSRIITYDKTYAEYVKTSILALQCQAESWGGSSLGIVTVKNHLKYWVYLNISFYKSENVKNFPTVQLFP